MAKLSYAAIIERDQRARALAELGLRLDLAELPQLMPRLVDLVAPAHLPLLAESRSILGADGYWLAESDDARRKQLALTPAGWAVFEPLQQLSREQVADVLATLAPDHRAQLVAALRTAHGLLNPAQTPTRTAVLREPRPGDMGWVIEQHGALYASEFGWNSAFEALVAEIVAGMLRTHDPAWERGWIAELDGQRVGSVFVVRKSPTEAQLRLLILSPGARGLGLGGRLTDECIAFARAKGYAKLVLWTNANLLAARAIYAQRGFQRVASEPYHGYGQDLVGESWELVL